MSQSGVKGTMGTAAHGGRMVLLQPGDVDVLRGTAPSGAEPRDAALSRDDAAEGWAEALAEARSRAGAAEASARRAEAEADSLRSALAVARVEAQEARRRAEEAERALAATNERVGAMRAAWWRWQAQLATVGPVARWRRRWPVMPGEFEADPLLAAPVE